MFQWFSGDVVSLHESPVYAVDLSSRVYDCSGVDIFHSEWGDNEFQWYVQGVLSLVDTMDYDGEFLR